MNELYEEMRDRPVDLDLVGLWSRLGVSLASGKISFDDAAPLAAIRRAITESSAVPPASP